MTHEQYAALMERSIEKEEDNTLNLAGKIADEAKRQAPRKTGALARSIRVSGHEVEAHKSYAYLVSSGTKPHTIRPKNPRSARNSNWPSALYWDGAHHPVQRASHPGTKPNPFLDRAIEKVGSAVSVEEALTI